VISELTISELNYKKTAVGFLTDFLVRCRQYGRILITSEYIYSNKQLKRICWYNN